MLMGITIRKKERRFNNKHKSKKKREQGQRRYRIVEVKEKNV